MIKSNDSIDPEHLRCAGERNIQLEDHNIDIYKKKFNDYT